MRRSSILLLLILLMAFPAHAQITTNGSIRGTVRDEHGGAIAGATVTAASATVPGVHTATTDKAGQYRLADLPPGDFTITAEIAGFARFLRSNVTMRTGLHVEIDVVLRVGALDETVEVRLDSPLLDTQRAGQAVNVSGEVLRSIPLLERREWFGALSVAPGVTSAEWVANERLFYVHGADSSANVVQVDGADLTSTTGSAIRHVSLNTEAVEDIQIKTAGVDASAPLGLGGVISIATASGTNTIRGVLGATVQPQAWNGSNTPGGTSSTVEQRQMDLSLGAPLVRDRLWAYGAYRYSDATTGVSRSSTQLEALRALMPGTTPADNTSTAHFSFAKLTAQLSPSHQLSTFHQRDFNPTMTADVNGVFAYRSTSGGTGSSVRVSSMWSDRLTTRFAASYNDKRRDFLTPDLEGPYRPVYQTTFTSAGVLAGSGLIINSGAPTSGHQTEPNSRLTIAFDATLFVGGAAGTHEVLTGVYLQPRNRIARNVLYHNDGFVIENTVLRRAGDYASGVLPYHRVIMDGTELTATRVEGQDYAAYLQDAWRPSSRLTINAGLRIDRVTWRDRIFDVTSVESLELGPRVGVNYAIRDDGRDVVRGHWVRVHDRPTQVAGSVGSTALGQRDLYDLNLDGIFETTLVTPPTLTVTRGRAIDPDLHVPYVNEWGAGYTRQLPGRTTVAVDGVHREFRDRTTLLETNSRFDGQRFIGYIDEAFNQTYLVTNNRWNWPVYTSLEASLTQRSARVLAIASYVRQWRHMGGTWQPNDPAAFLQPSAFDNDRGIGAANGSLSSPADANSLSGTHMTQTATASAQWQDHAIRAAGTYQAPWNLTIAANYTFQSGIWSGPIVTRIAAADLAFGTPTVVLSNGRVVSNPLATTIRFAHPTRGDGQLKTPRLHVLNLRVGRRFETRRLKFDIAGDVFNVTNNGADLSFQTGANQQLDAAFGRTRFRQLPRSGQVYVRASF